MCNVQTAQQVVDGPKPLRLVLSEQLSLPPQVVLGKLRQPALDAEEISSRVTSRTCRRRGQWSPRPAPTR